MQKAFIAGFFLLLLAMTAWPRSVPAGTNHPLDALEADEITRAAAILRLEGHVDEQTPILSMSLEAPPKAAVLSWRPGEPVSRSARAVVRRDRVTREFVIDLDKDKIASVEEVPGPGQPTVSLPEILSAIQATVANGEMQAALRRRGITNFEALFCAPRTVGNFAEPMEQERRLVKVDCFDLSRNPDSVFAAPIEGLYALFDLESREVLKVVDLGVMPVTDQAWSLAPEAEGKLREVKPVRITAPQGSNIHIDGWQVSWQNWRFHLRWDMRAGLILSLLRYQDGDRLRDIMYQGNVSEIFVPYQDTTETWYYRTYMDEGDYGLGNMHSPLIPGVDCPPDATYLTPVMANAGGGADSLDKRICLFERSTGDATWRHFDFISEALDGRANVELVARFIAAVGNYDYLFDWVLDNKGRVTYRIGASGLDAVKGVEAGSLADETAGRDTEFGPLIAPKLAGINHDHFFSLRFDLDVDGPSNRFVRDRLVAQRQSAGSKRRSIWKPVREVSKTDSESKYRLSYDHPSLWRVESGESRNQLGYSTSYAFQPAANARPLVDEDDPPLQRAQFVNYHLWVTPYSPSEQWAAGDFPNQSAPGQGLPAWSANGRNVEDTDIVLWYTLGFHHIPSAEDWPVYNLGWQQVTMRPYNFFDRNPAMDLPEGTVEE